MHAGYKVLRDIAERLATPLPDERQQALMLMALTLTLTPTLTPTQTPALTPTLTPALTLTPTLSRPSC